MNKRLISLSGEKNKVQELIDIVTSSPAFTDLSANRLSQIRKILAIVLDNDSRVTLSHADLSLAIDGQYLVEPPLYIYDFLKTLQQYNKKLGAHDRLILDILNIPAGLVKNKQAIEHLQQRGQQSIQQPDESASQRGSGRSPSTTTGDHHNRPRRRNSKHHRGPLAVSNDRRPKRRKLVVKPGQWIAF